MNRLTINKKNYLLIFSLYIDFLILFCILFAVLQKSEVRLLAIIILILVTMRLPIINLIRVESQRSETLIEAHEKLTLYTLQVEELIRVKERNCIARDIHDSLGHTLTCLNIQLQTALRLWLVDPKQAHGFLKTAQSLAENAMKEVRKSVTALRADLKEDQCLEEDIESLVQNFRYSTGIPTYTNINIQANLSTQVAKTIYRITQESLTNIFKYAEAKEVKIDLYTTDKSICLIVVDNGKGFDINEKKQGFGIKGMQERVAALNGYLRFDSAPEKGCRVIAEVIVA
jgi:signal transduction histidine kinase